MGAGIEIAGADASSWVRSRQVEDFEGQVMMFLAKAGGEFNRVIANSAPGSKAHITHELFDRLVQRGVVEYLDPRTRARITMPVASDTNTVIARHGSNLIVRLTDEGRRVVARINEMTIAPMKIEVSSI